MKNRALLSAIAACFFVAACSEKPAEAPKPQAAAVVPLPPEAPKAAAASANQDAKPADVKQVTAATAKGGCTQGKCKVDIQVTEGATPCAKATPDALTVFKDNKNDDIKWSISTPGWKFAAKGIVWKKAGQKQFSHEAGGNTNNYKWKDANTDKETYEYSIHLVNGTKKCDVDPSVGNGDDTASP